MMTMATIVIEIATQTHVRYQPPCDLYKDEGTGNYLQIIQYPMLHGNMMAFVLFFDR